SERQDGVAVIPRAVAREREPQAVPAAPERERPETHVEPERDVQASVDAFEARSLPVRAAAHAQPARNPLVLRAEAQREGGTASGRLQALLEKRLQPRAILHRTADQRV